MIDSVTNRNAAAQAASLSVNQSSGSSTAGEAQWEADLAAAFGGHIGGNYSASVAKSSSTKTPVSTEHASSAIAAATNKVVAAATHPTNAAKETAASKSATTTTETSAAGKAATGTGASAASNTTAATEASTASDAAAADDTSSSTGIEALVTAIMNGSVQATYVTNPSQLQETSPAGTDTMPSFYYASNQTATQLANLLGGTVVQRPAFGQDEGWTEPNANFIELSNGDTVNAADLAYYTNCSSEGSAQLTADLTQTINEGSAWTNYYEHGGQMPTFATGYVGAPISGMTYAAGTIGADGNVINPAMQQSGTQGA